MGIPFRVTHSSLIPGGRSTGTNSVGSPASPGWGCPSSEGDERGEAGGGKPELEETMGKEAMGAETMGVVAMGVEAMSVEAMGVEAMSVEAMGAEAMGAESVGEEGFFCFLRRGRMRALALLRSRRRASRGQGDGVASPPEGRSGFPCDIFPLPSVSPVISSVIKASLLLIFFSSFNSFSSSALFSPCRPCRPAMTELMLPTASPSTRGRGMLWSGQKMEGFK
jgi:hypothetical protein